MNDVRVRLTKTVPIKTRTSANVHIRPEDVNPEVMKYLQSGHTELMQLEPLDASNTEFHLKVEGRIIAKAYLKDAEHELPEFQGQDAKDACKKYINELEGLVDECIEKFSR